MRWAAVLSMRSVALTPCSTIKSPLSILLSPVSTALVLFLFQENTTGNSNRFVAHVELTFLGNIALFILLKYFKDVLFTGSDV